jgi:hypothetical protein
MPSLSHSLPLLHYKLAKNIGTGTNVFRKIPKAVLLKGTKNTQPYTKSWEPKNILFWTHLARLGIPELDRLLAILAPGHNDPLLRVPVHTLDIGTVPTQHLEAV